MRLPVRAPDRRLGGQCQDFHGSFVIGNRTKNVKRSSSVCLSGPRTAAPPANVKMTVAGAVRATY